MGSDYIPIVLMITVGMIYAAPSSSYFNADLDPHWESFKQTFQRSYFDQEEILRRTIWESNVNLIQKHNLRADMGEHTYWLGINKYADMSPEEVSKYLANYHVGTEESKGAHFLPLSNVAIPEEVDWREKGYVTPIKDQGMCGSCWTFSTTGSLEGQHFRATGKLISLSEQQIVDCTASYGMHGCHGGLMDIAFEYIKDRGGVDTESSYPYTAMDGDCHYNKSAVGATVTGFTDIQSGDEDALKQALASVGPISVAIDAAGSSFHFYKSVGEQHGEIRATLKWPETQTTSVESPAKPAIRLCDPMNDDKKKNL